MRYTYSKPYSAVLKQRLKLNLKALNSLNSMPLFIFPSSIKHEDIYAIFKAAFSMMRKKIIQEQNQKYLRLKVKYIELKKLYNRLKPKYS